MADLGRAVIRPELAAMVDEAGRALAADAELALVDIAPPALPDTSVAWAMSNLATLAMDLGDRWPACKDDLTLEMAFGMQMASEYYNLEMAAKVEADKIATNEAVADIFDQVDVAHLRHQPRRRLPGRGDHEHPGGRRAGGRGEQPGPHRALQHQRQPAIAVPIGQLDGLPVSMQLVAAHHRDALLLDLARVVERERPWPLVASSPDPSRAADPAAHRRRLAVGIRASSRG